MSGPDDVPPDLLAPVRAACLALPEVREEAAWEGVRWQVRRRTFAHLLTIVGGRPQAFARAAGTDGPVTVLMLRSSGPELEVLRAGGPPFFPAPWGPDVVGMVLGPSVDWAEVGELVTESFLVRAPRALREAVERLLPGE
ncbi:MmcQ/YjbR family DNA-binding protein [Pseudonocardia humida]|uniref:MmcQ/YjbR family DNA-binding protein n=1 Tax=Pseudonocardia humida TaxID=2800819 RepID=A0ABT0ZSG1_9PSEU|nr:MmcQ/YjbR family DNA-binding protein [Pseudonocardia humida]MCO1653653.1 MmcQ/YjbR family DNA-binding protein [Pseudonocardia humida]